VVQEFHIGVWVVVRSVAPRGISGRGGLRSGRQPADPGAPADSRPGNFISGPCGAGPEPSVCPVEGLAPERSLVVVITGEWGFDESVRGEWRSGFCMAAAAAAVTGEGVPRHRQRAFLIRKNRRLASPASTWFPAPNRTGPTPSQAVKSLDRSSTNPVASSPQLS
jgi:hypothetical protein